MWSLWGMFLLWIEFTPSVWGRVTANTLSWVLTCFICSLWNSMLSLHVSYHALFPPSFLTHTHTHKNTHRLSSGKYCTSHTLSLSGSALIWQLYLSIWLSTDPKDTDSLSAVSNGQVKKVTTIRVFSCSLLLLGKFAVFCPCETEHTAKTDSFLDKKKHLSCVFPLTSFDSFKYYKEMFSCLQEKEPLRMIPLKEVHKVQECKQRYLTCPSIFPLYKNMSIVHGGLCLPFLTQIKIQMRLIWSDLFPSLVVVTLWWEIICLKSSPHQGRFTYR